MTAYNCYSVVCIFYFYIPVFEYVAGINLSCAFVFFFLYTDAKKFQESEKGKGQTDLGLNIPLLMQNKVPEGYETDDKLDVGLRPEEVY